MAAGISTCPVGDPLQEDHECFRAQEQCSLKCATMFTVDRAWGEVFYEQVEARAWLQGACEGISVADHNLLAGPPRSKPQTP